MAGISNDEREIRADARKAVIQSAQKSQANAKKLWEQADEIRSKSSTLLRPDDFITGKEDAGTLYKYITRQNDGTYRPLTLRDLVEFQKRRTTLANKWRSGVKAQDVIDLSAVTVRHQKASDLVKSRQIHAAMPFQTRGGEIRFVTSTGPESESERQYVTIKMLNFDAAVTSPVDVKKILKQVTHGPLAFACSCGQFRFVFAYMATVGGYGLPQHRENAFPKQKNYELRGIACKHIVKVCTMLLHSPSLNNYVHRLIENERNKTQSKARREKMDEMRALEESLANEKAKGPKTTKQKAAEKAKRKVSDADMRRIEKNKKTIAAKVAKKDADKQKRLSESSQYREAANNYASLVEIGALTRAQADRKLAEYAKKLGVAK